MKEMETFLIQLEMGLINLEDKIHRLNDLLQTLKDEGLLDEMQKIYHHKGIDLKLNPN